MLLTLPPEVLQGIVTTGLMASPQLSAIFSMSTHQQLAQKHEQLTESLTKQGLDRSTALAFLDVMPLLLERRAISEYVRRNPDLMGALPNLETPEEAAEVGAMERRLTAGQKGVLLTLLEHAQMKAMQS